MQFITPTHTLFCNTVPKPQVMHEVLSEGSYAKQAVESLTHWPLVIVNVGWQEKHWPVGPYRTQPGTVLLLRQLPMTLS